MKIEVKEIRKMIRQAEDWSRYKPARDIEETFWNDGINTVCKHLEYLITKKIKEMKK